MPASRQGRSLVTFDGVSTLDPKAMVGLLGILTNGVLAPFQFQGPVTASAHGRAAYGPSCHLTDFNNTRNPNHAAAGFPQQCEVCHTTSAWVPASVDHNATRSPLTGAHTRVSCAQCNPGGRYTGAPTDCYSCHRDDYPSDHPREGRGTQCQQCHNTSSWEKEGDFRHGFSRVP